MESNEVGMESIRRKCTCRDAIHTLRDSICLTAITYQSFGLDKNEKDFRTFIFGAPVGLDVHLSVLLLRFGIRWRFAHISAITFAVPGDLEIFGVNTPKNAQNNTTQMGGVILGTT